MRRACCFSVVFNSSDYFERDRVRFNAERSFDAMDENKDVSLSQDEMKACSQYRDFARLEKNSDGNLSRQEYGGDKAATGGTRGTAAGSTAPRGETSSR